MKLPVSWLKEYVEIDAGPEELAEKLTFSGIEVEGIKTIGAEYTGISAARVVSVKKHPDADSLSVCVVNNGKEDLQVVCGADNFSAGDIVPLAAVGAVLPSGMKIKKARLRGVESSGMLCAEDELALSDDHSGIMILPSDTEPGTPLSEVLGPPETVLELEITWNRGDCLSIIGIAREFAAIYGKTLKLPPVDYPEEGTPSETEASVAIEDPEGCPRYSGRLLRGVNLGPSPFWMQRRLACCGVRPVSNIVDITNYVMLECGHPLHAFDFSLLQGGKVVVRRARKGEILATLDGVQREIDESMLVIADSGRPIALAGVMGGAGSEIVETTKDVFLESACFRPSDIKAASTAVELATESSYRFERGIDVNRVSWAGARAARLMVELAGAAAAPGVLDSFPGKKEETLVKCRFQRVRDLLGINIKNERIKDILNSLELNVAESSEEACMVRVPGFRNDIEMEADLVEEVARINGLEDIPVPVPSAKVVPDFDDSRTTAVMSLRSALRGLGLTETMNYSFLSGKFLDLFSEEDRPYRVKLPNPVSADHGVMRNSLVPQMAESLGRNFSRQVREAMFFEAGRTFTRTEDGEISEEEKLCIGIMGKAGRTGINLVAPVTHQESFFWMKGIIESLLEAQGRSGSARFEPADRPWLRKGEGLAVILEDNPVGTFGMLADRICEKWRINVPVAVAELAIDPILEKSGFSGPLEPVPVHPSISRDVALIVDETVTHADIVKIMREAATRELTDIHLFDIFTGKGIGHARKSMAYNLTYQSLERTLTDEDANGYHEAIKKALKTKLKAEIREGT